MSDSDLETLLGFYQEGRNKGTFENGIEMALRRILASPQFVFRFERDPVSISPDTNYRISDLDLASRLSFFLWSSIPDDELIRLASQGKLKNPAVLSSRWCGACWPMRAHRRWWTTSPDSVLSAQPAWAAPDLETFPNFDDNLRQKPATETELFVGSIFHEDHNVLDLLNANYTFVNERLGRHYGIPKHLRKPERARRRRTTRGEVSSARAAC